MRIHSGEKPFTTSQQCGVSFTQGGILNRDMKVHTGRSRTHALCLESFDQNEKLEVHMRIHTGEKLYSCPSVERVLIKMKSLMYT